MDLRPVESCHRDHLASFSCAIEGAPHSLEVEEQVRGFLVQELIDNRVKALGSWDGDRLAALIAYTSTNPLWMVTLLATDRQYKRRKQALRLKLDLLQRARQAGAQAVTSKVHVDNTAMRSLNAKLGGIESAPSDPENPYYIWTIRL